MFKEGQRVKLTAAGKMSCTQGPIQEFPKNHVFKGTIVKILGQDEIPIGPYVVQMDDEGFQSHSHGEGFNTFGEEELKAI